MIKYFICLYCDDGRHYLLKDGSLSCGSSFKLCDLKVVSRSYAYSLLKSALLKFRYLDAFDWGIFSVNTDDISCD